MCVRQREERIREIQEGSCPRCKTHLIRCVLYTEAVWIDSTMKYKGRAA